jgi:hypothetical protein
VNAPGPNLLDLGEPSEQLRLACKALTTHQPGSNMNVTRRLLLASALMLFLELALIRWLGANVLHLSYFTNFVLLGSFLGIGLGFLLSRTPRSFLPASLVALTGLVALVFVAPVQVDQTSDEIIYFTNIQASGPPAWLLLPLIFCSVAAILVGPAEAVGRCFRDLPPLDAYRLDLVGSLTGIAAFALLSFARAPSVVWGLVVAAAYVVLLRPTVPLWSGVAALTLVGVLALESLTPGVSWSPYYKVETESLGGEPEQVAITVNGVPHQVMAPAWTSSRSCLPWRLGWTGVRCGASSIALIA